MLWEVDFMRHSIVAVLLSASVLLLSCSSEKKDTTPKNEPTPEAAQAVQTSEQVPAQEGVPADYIEQMENVWASALPAVVQCFQRVVDEKDIRGVDGFIIVRATVGATPHPRDVQIKEVHMKKNAHSEEFEFKGFEPCVKDVIKSLSFPTWGTEPRDEHSYAITVSY